MACLPTPEIRNADSHEAGGGENGPVSPIYPQEPGVQIHLSTAWEIR